MGSKLIRTLFGKVTCGKFNKYINKPNRGLWGSPVDSSYGWKEWCVENNFRTNTFDVCTKWRIKPDSKILVIDSLSDLQSVMTIYGKCENKFERPYLNFYRICEDFDGMLLTERGNDECHLGDGYVDLNAWDCESIVVWNSDVVEIEGEC